MSKKSTKALASAALMSLVLTTALSAGPVKAAQGKVTRTSGTTRYATAAEVAKTNWAQGSKNVVLVSGEGYADAVSASALAKKLDAPILLTASDTLSSDAKSALDTLKPENVYVIGGNASISQNIRDGLKADKYNLTELGGTTRYETNAKVADELVKLGVDPSNVMVVGGEGFSDALSVAPVAAAKGQILLLASNDQSATQPVIDFVKANNSKATVVGTKNVINDTIYDALGAASRVDGGTSRFDTNLKVLDAFKDSLKTDKVYIANASAADPDNLYADALVASAVAGKYSAPLVLVDKDGSEGTTNALAYLKNNTDSSTDVQLIGGTAVVPQSIEDDINALYNPQDQDQATAVDSVEATNLNQIKVTFNGKVDSDTAEDESNYKVNGASLSDGDAHATLQDDNKTVLINLGNKQDQNDDVDVTVKKGILSEDKSNTIPEFTKTVTFSDVTAPVVDSVEPRGNNKLTVKFSEPINIGTGNKADIDDGDYKISGLSSFLSKFKIDDQNISNFGLDSDYSLAKNTVIDGDDNLYSDEIEFYFTSSLSNGNKTLKISDGNSNDVLSDAAGFPFKETSTDFDIDALSTKPEVQSITASDDKVYVNFDRPMDSNTAQNASNYKVNDDSSDVTKAELKKDDTQVKLTVSELNKGSNKLYISDKVKDAYGNKVANDTYKSFELEEDDTKPAVNSVSVLDKSTIRVRFSKDVDALYAADPSNYKLQENDGNDITNYIQDRSGDNYQDKAAITIPGKTKAPAEGDTTDVVDIHLSKDSIQKYELTDSKYTLTIKNIQDRASTPNIMDDYTETFNGSDDIDPEVEGTAIALKDSDFDSSNPYRKVVVNFNKAMDASSLTDIDNYKFKNGSEDIVNLPSGTTIDTSSDNKSAIIKFPSAYGTDKSKTGDNFIKAISVIGVKDENGNGLAVSQTVDVESASLEPTTKVKQNSVNVKYNNDDLNVNLSFDKSIDNLNADDFKVQGITPDSAHKNADGSITLVYKDGNPNISTIKLAGLHAKVTTADQDKIKTTDVNGSPITAIVDNNVTPYGFTADPKIYNTNTWTADSTSKAVGITFDTPIDPSSIKKDDFTFAINGGTTLKANKVDVEDNTVTFTFTTDDNSDTALSKFADGSTIKVTPRDDTKISTLEDKNDEYGYYVPSHDDKDGYSVTITSAGQAQAIKDAGTVAPVFNVPVDTTSIPTVEGYTLSVKSTSNPDVYDNTGKGVKAGTSQVVYTLTSDNGTITANTNPITVVVK